MLIDSHCHLPKNSQKIATIIKEAKQEGVVKFINIGTNIKSSKHACETTTQFPEVTATVGIYPHDDKKSALDTLLAKLKTLINQYEKIVGIGECGIDISNWKNGRTVEEQKRLFECQIELALEHNLPIVLHNRNGDEIVLEILEKYRSDKLRGVAHCFSSNWEFAQKLLDLNFYISFSGIITYPSKEKLTEVVKKVPLDRFVLETDSPYLPPTGHRGEINQPKYVKMVARKMAELRNEPVATIAKRSYDNTCHIFVRVC